MTRVAAVDCGTNSIRLLVADLDAATGTAVDVVRRMEVVRLGQDVDRTGRLAPEALARTLAALRAYADEITSLGAERVRMVATSATRDAANRQDFVDGVRAVLGVEPDVASGDEEAALSFVGATRGIASDATTLVVDIGGGSTELVLGTDRVLAGRSVDVGCVRLTERHVRTDPLTPAEVRAIRTDVARALDDASDVVPLGDADVLVGVAGTVTTIAAIVLGLDAYDPERIHRAELSADAVLEVVERLVTMPRAERAAIPVMHPGRVDVIAAGALVLAAVIERVGLSTLVASEHDILDGIAWSTLDPR